MKSRMGARVGERASAEQGSHESWRRKRLEVAKGAERGTDPACPTRSVRGPARRGASEAAAAASAGGGPSEARVGFLQGSLTEAKGPLTGHPTRTRVG